MKPARCTPSRPKRLNLTMPRRERGTSRWPPARAFTAGAQHSAGTLPLTDTNPVDGARGQQAFNSVNYNPLLRAALVRMDRWVTGEEDPPPSRYPRLADGTAVAPEQPREVFAAIPGVGFPLHPPQVIRLAFGPDAASGKGSRTAYPNCPTRENQIARPGAAARGKETRS
jgi:hypothetical protein